jgi:glutamate synthase domain-containing protein 1
VAHIKGEKSHSIVEQGLKILENLDHRGAVGADKLMGDGAGILIQIARRVLPRRDGGAGPVNTCRRPASTAWA